MYTWQQFNDLLKKDYPQNNREWRKDAWKDYLLEQNREDNSLDTFPCVTIQQESNMQVAVNTNQDNSKWYLERRLSDSYYQKRDELEEHFLSTDKPKTYGEAKKWLKDHNYTLTVDGDDEYSDKASYHEFNWTFRWGTKQPDRDGFTKATAELKKALQAATDIISVKTDEDARLKALQDFEAATFH